MNLNLKEVVDSCITDGTKSCYTARINGIKKWLRSQENCEQYFHLNGDLNIENFTSSHFEKYVLHRINDPLDNIKVDSLRGYRSAIKSIYKRNRKSIPHEYGDDLNTFFEGLKRIEASIIQSGEKTGTGKLPLTYAQYYDLCRRTMQLHDSGFSHLFLTTQWNLMCRSKSVETIHVNHLQDKMDAIGCVLYKTKTNQNGHGRKDPIHVFANPFNPDVCWFTALAIYLACNPSHEAGQLFPGSNQRIRFSKIINRLLCDANDNKKQFGTHSIRKGASTFVCAGSLGGPSIVSVCLRCGWSIGPVQDRYLKYENAGDHFLGRVVSGLPLNKPEFSVVPPHFENTKDMRMLVVLEQTFPIYMHHPSIFGILLLCLASLVYHREHLKNILPKNHALHSTYIFRDDEEFEYLRLQISINESEDMRASGVPPYIHLYKQQKETKDSVDALPNIIITKMSDLIDEKGVAAGNVTHAVLKELIQDALNTASQYNNGILLSQESERTRLRELYNWDGALRLLPKTFKFPKVDTFTAWLLWWFGSSANKYPPFSQISSRDLPTRNMQKSLSEWKIMMKHIERIIREVTKCVFKAPETESAAINLFRIAEHHIPISLSTPRNHIRRFSQLKMVTALKLLRQSIQSSNPNRKKMVFKSRRR